MDKNLNYTIRVNLVDQASNSADGVNRRLQQMAESAQQAAPRFNQLNMSIQQVARELPAFSYSISTGFMAISNNLPILADTIAQVRKENAVLAASGQQVVPVWRQVASSLLSWQTAMSVGITLLTVYGTQIVEAISNQLSFGKTVDENAESQKQLNDAWKIGVENAQKELTSLKVLYSAATDDTRSRKERLDAVKQLQTEYPAYFENLSNESIMAGNAADAYTRLAQSLTDAAIARASMDKMTENATKLLDLNDQREVLEKQLAPAKALRDQLMNTPIIGEGGAQALNNSIIRVARLESSLKSVTSEIDALNAVNEKLSKGINVSSLFGGGKGSTSKELNTDLASIGGLTNKINELKEAQSRASAETAIDLEKEIQLYKERLNLLQLTIAKGAAGNLADDRYKDLINVPEIEKFDLPKLEIPVGINAQQLQKMHDDFKRSLAVYVEDAELAGERISGMLTGGIANFAQSFGESLASGNGLEIFQSMLTSVMSMLQQFGTALIAAGTAALAFQSLLLNPIAAIISGAALVAAAAAAKAALQSATTAFADGGIVSGPTLALVGEYAGASSNPEVIAPLNKLKSMIEPAVQNDTVMNGEVRFVIRGEVLEGILQKMNRKRMRTR